MRNLRTTPDSTYDLAGGAMTAEPEVGPDVVFVAATTAQAEDALAVNRRLGLATWLVATWPGVLDRLGSALSKSEMRVIMLAPPVGRRMRRLVVILRGRRLANRLAGPHGPIFVFGNDSTWVEGALVVHLAQLGAKSLLIQDGIIDSGDPIRVSTEPSNQIGRLGMNLLRQMTLVPRQATYLYGTAGCDVICAYSDWSKHLMSEWGADEHRIRVTGAPRFDSLLASLAVSQAPDERTTILFLGAMFASRGWAASAADALWVATVNRFAIENRDFRVILRPHPTEELASYNEAIARLDGTHFEVDRQTPIHEALRAASAVVMRFPSSTMVEAAALGRPVVYVDFGYEAQDNAYAHDPAVLKVAPPGLNAAIRNAISDGPVRQRLLAAMPEFVTRYLGPTDGCSADRVADQIRLLRESS